MKRFSNEEIEQLACKRLRNSKLFTNQGVDCFVMGFKEAQEPIFRTILMPDGIIERAENDLNDALKWVDDSAGYSGRSYTREEAARKAVLNMLYAAIVGVKKSETYKEYLQIIEKEK